MSNDGFWARLRKARLFRVLIVYLGASWGVLQVTAELRETLDLPAWIGPVAFILLLVGLVVILATAWVQSHPHTARRAESRQVPGSWEVSLSGLKQAVRQRELPHLTWGRAVLGGVVAFSLLFGLAGLYVVIQDRGRSFTPPEAIAEEAAPGIAILPFRVRGEELQVWREGMVEALASNLDGASGYRTIAPQTVLARWRERVPGLGANADLETSLAVARSAGARYAVSGSVIPAGSNLRMSADVYDVRSGEVLEHARSEGPADSVLALVDRLSIGVLRSLVSGSEAASSAMSLARVATGSIEAYKAYLEGEALYRRGDFEGAIPLFQRAVEADSTFALAHYRLGLAYGWTPAVGTGLGPESFERAVRHSERLPPRQANLVRAENLRIRGSMEAFDLLRRAVQQHPEDPEAWYLLGEAYIHNGDALPVSADAAEEAFARAVSLDPGFAPYQEHWIDLAIIRGPDSVQIAERIDHYRRATSSDSSAELRGLELVHWLAAGDSTHRSRARIALDTVSDIALLRIRTAMYHPRVMKEQVAVRQAQYERAEPGQRVFLGAIQLFPTLAYGTGRFREGLAYIDVPGIQPRLAATVLYVARTFGLPVSDTRLDEAWAEAVEDEGFGHPYPALTQAARLADAGRWEGHAEVVRVVRDTVASLEAQADTLEAAWWETAAKTAEAYAYVARGQTGQAIQALEASHPYHFDLQRWWLAEAYEREGRLEDAARLLESFWYQPLSSLAAYRLGRVYEELGAVEKARRAYADFAAAWSGADPELQPMVEEAREAIARLIEAPGG